MQLKAQRRKRPWVGIMLALLGGTFGLHRAYLGEWRWMVVYVALCWTGRPPRGGIHAAALPAREWRTGHSEHGLVAKDGVMMETVPAPRGGA